MRCKGYTTMASEVEIAKNQVEITNLKTDIQKIDQSIEKIGEATSQISKLLAVHDNRLDDSEQTDAEIKKEVKVLHQRITEGGQEVIKAIHESEIRINESATKQHNLMNDTIAEVGLRVNNLEQYKCYVMGIIATIAAVAGVFGYLM